MGDDTRLGIPSDTLLGGNALSVMAQSRETNQ